MKKDLILFNTGENPKNFGFNEFENVNIIDQSPGELRKTLNRTKEKLMVLGGSDETNRMAVESKKVEMLISPERTRTRDFMHFKDSGLNHILCRLAKKNNVKIAFSFNDLLKAKIWEERAAKMGKIMQNIKLCRKTKTRMIFASFATREDELRSHLALNSFAKVLGMNTKESKEAFQE